MKNNEILQRTIQDAISWEPSLNVAEIGITVNDGIVTLTGTVDHYSKKLMIEEVTKKVAGVKAVVEKLEIKFGNSAKSTDSELTAAVLNAFLWNWLVPNNSVKVKVEDGWVTLDGQLQWNYQRLAARNAIKDLPGLKGITNNIQIKSEITDNIEKLNIENALHRNASINDGDIDVKVIDTKVILTGTVKSWYQKDEAERTVWNTPGVLFVDNELVVEHEYDYVT